MEEIPDKFCGAEVSELFIELSDDGYVLGTPTRYTLNARKFKKFNVELSEDVRRQKPPNIMMLLNSFKDGHKRLLKAKPITAQTDLTLLRHLIRKYDAKTIFAHIEPFLIEARDQKIKQCPLKHFGNWLTKKLDRINGKR